MDLDRAYALVKRDILAARLVSGIATEARAFYEDASQLVAAVCSRRAGKTYSGNAYFVKRALTTRGGRRLYINETSNEVRRLAWIGNRGDGMAVLAEQLKAKGVNVRIDHSKLTIHFVDIDSWIYCLSVDDEASIRKALGGAYHEIWWDEAQKIPPRFNDTIREVLMPTILDFGGRLRFTGTPVRQQTSLFYQITQPDVSKRTAGWSVHHWIGLHNPFFGATREERYRRHVLALQRLLSEPSVDTPVMRREAFGEWVNEDANHVYAVNRVSRETLCYRPHVDYNGRNLGELLATLPGFSEREYFLALGVDIGYAPDPFALSAWAWSLRDPCLYEVLSLKRQGLTSDEQAAMIIALREQASFAVIVADAGGPAKPTVAGWSKGWQERYPIPVEEAKKSDKHSAIERLNSDILAGNLKLCDGSPLHEEMRHLQWAKAATATGRIVEEPSQDNHCCDAALYAHRHSYHHRYRPEPARPAYGSPEYWAQEEQRMMREAGL